MTLPSVAMSYDLALKQLGEVIRKTPTANAALLMPLLFSFRGKPLEISRRFFPHEPMFRLGVQPRRSIIMAGRQVGKSLGISVRGIFQAGTNPYFHIVYALPSSKQAEVMSNNYFRPLSNDSVFGANVVGKDAVLQKDFANGSSVFFRYIGDSADRARGLAISGATYVDECQDHDLDCVDVLLAAMGASPFKFVHYTGTPKTFDNPMHRMWDLSSQAEWTIPCDRCNHENICCKEHGILKMIGDKTLVCQKCGAPVDSTKGYYLHRYPDRQLAFPGYRMPQVIFPMHYADRTSWEVIREAVTTKPPRFYWNEIFGESFDSGTKLITQEQIKSAAIVKYYHPKEFPSSDYAITGAGVDWGGKGKEQAQDTEDFISNTAVAVGGMRTDGKIEVSFLAKTPYHMDYGQEAEFVKDTVAQAHLDFVASDNGGAGDLREFVLQSAGIPGDMVIPFTYGRLGAKKPVIFWDNPQKRLAFKGGRSAYMLDKTRAITIVVEGIKLGWILLPEYDSVRHELSDFDSIYEEVRDNPLGNTTRLIRRISKRTDDVVHAITFLCMGLYYRSGAWPEFAAHLANGVESAEE